jgi:hypothetical protein
VFFARRGEMVSHHLEDQKISMLVLLPIQNGVV